MKDETNEKLGQEKENHNPDNKHEPSFKEIREMISSCYLNLALCFLKTNQYQHAYNTAHRAMVGDEEPPNPVHDVLTDAQKAKSLFRKCQAGEHLDTVTKESIVGDLKKALQFDPKNSDISKTITRVEKEIKLIEKKQAKKLGGFLKNKRLGDDKTDASTNASSPEKGLDAALKAEEAKQIQPGLYEAGKETFNKENNDENAVEFFDNVCDELTDLMVNDPEKFKQVKEKMRLQCEKEGVLPEQVLGAADKIIGGEN
jgi:hypothetical protein